jgi:hypothetical protein
MRRTQIALCGALLVMSAATAADDDDDSAPAAATSGPPTLNAEQQRAVGIVVAHPVPAESPDRIEALGEVLDVSALIADLGESSAASAAEHAAATESARLKELYRGGAGASLKMLEAAQAEQARAQAQSDAAGARLALRWGPVADLSPGGRQSLLEHVVAGKGLLVRADVPGRHALGALPGKALLDVDGVLVPGRVLGALKQMGEVQGAGVLIEVPHAPAGLGTGARIPVALLGAAQKGVALPDAAVLYDEGGAYVFKRLRPGPDPKRVGYGPVKVKLLSRYGSGWLVDGVDDDDDVVVHGAGVLWSLHGMGEQPADDDD